MKLPVISGRDLVKALERTGYVFVRQNGSHIQMKCKEAGRKPVTVPDHRTIDRGLLRKIMRDARLNLAELLDLLNK